MRDVFAATVGEFRGQRMTKDAALATEAGVYSGADAVKAGLVDAIVRPNVAFEVFIAQINRTGMSANRKPRGALASTTKEKRMPETSGLAAVRAAAAETENSAETAESAVSSEALAAATADGVSQGAAAATTAERGRAKAILGSEHAAGREALAQHFAFETGMSADDAIAALAKAPKAEARTSRLDGLVPSPQVTSEDAPPADSRAAGLAAAVDSLIARKR
jgi:hypothetical protein